MGIAPVIAQTRSLYKEQQADIERFEVAIAQYLAGEIEEDVFRVIRLNNGVYGQRQGGTNQMVRIKLPAGTITPEQLELMAKLSTEYSRGWGHITTRQNIQFHFVELTKMPALLREIAEVGLTSREACGDTVRNVMARLEERGLLRKPRVLPRYLHDPQSHPLFARRAALVEHLEQHHVPPTENKQQQRAEAHADLAKKRQGHEQQPQDQGAQSQVDGKCQGTRQQPRRTQWQVDAFGRFDLVAGIQWRGQRCVPWRC